MINKNITTKSITLKSYLRSRASVVASAASYTLAASITQTNQEIFNNDYVYRTNKEINFSAGKDTQGFIANPPGSHYGMVLQEIEFQKWTP